MTIYFYKFAKRQLLLESSYDVTSDFSNMEMKLSVFFTNNSTILHSDTKV